jgi:hypothetical protein
MEVLRMRALLIAAALTCSACGLFLDDFAKGSDAGGGDTESESDTSTDVQLTPCDGVDLELLPCCNLEDSCFYSFFPSCDCPTCPWDAIDCGVGDGGVPDAGADSGAGG